MVIHQAQMVEIADDDRVGELNAVVKAHDGGQIDASGQGFDLLLLYYVKRGGGGAVAAVDTVGMVDGFGSLLQGDGMLVARLGRSDNGGDEKKTAAMVSFLVPLASDFVGLLMFYPAKLAFSFNDGAYLLLQGVLGIISYVVLEQKQLNINEKRKKGGNGRGREARCAIVPAALRSPPPENVKGDVLFLKHVLICFIANDETLRSYRESYDHAFENETEVEALTNQEEVELRSKIEALGLEVTKVPSKSSQHLDELEIAKELDKLSAKLDDVDEMISSAMASDPQVKSLLSGTADVWMPVITASAEERRTFTASIADDNPEPKGKSLT
ncbi:hypothetical protein ACLB2K_073198 [Fragaria x ananassa]